MSCLSKEDREKLYFEHNYLQKQVHFLGNTMWVVNSILITGSLLVAFQSRSDVFPTPIASLILIWASFFITMGNNKINKTSYERMSNIRKALGILKPDEIYETQVEGKLWYTLRNNTQYLLYTSLTSVYLFLLLQRIFLSLLVFALGILAIVARITRSYIDKQVKRGSYQKVNSCLAKSLECL
jgi:hypothetical protein